MLLAATSLIASFLGSHALARGGFTLVTWIAIAALVISLLSAMSVILPQLKLVFAVPASMLRARLSDEPSAADVHGEIQRLLERAIVRNGAALKRLYGGYNLAAGCVCVQVLSWVLQLAVSM
jgi:hypothetical protein